MNSTVQFRSSAHWSDYIHLRNLVDRLVGKMYAATLAHSTSPPLHNLHTPGLQSAQRKFAVSWLSVAKRVVAYDVSVYATVSSASHPADGSIREVLNVALSSSSSSRTTLVCTFQSRTGSPHSRYASGTNLSTQKVQSCGSMAECRLQSSPPFVLLETINQKHCWGSPSAAHPTRCFVAIGDIIEQQ